MKKSKTAALLAASLLIYGGAFSVQAETYYGDGKPHNLGKVELTDLAVDNAGTVVNLAEGSTVKGTFGNLSTEGGTIEMTGTDVTGTGLWANRKDGTGGSITVTGGSVIDGDIAAQGADSQITISGAEVRNIGNIIARHQIIIDNVDKTDTMSGGGKISFVNGTKAKADNMIVADGGEVNISSGANVTTKNIDADAGIVSVGSGTMTVNGTANFKDGGQLALTSGANVDVTGKVYLYDTAGISVDGSIMTFQSGSELHVDGSSVGKAVDGVVAANKGTIVFENGSATYTTVNANNTVATVATAMNDGSSIEVKENALLYVDGIKADGTTQYDITTATVQQNQQTGWNGKVYGANLLQVMDKETGTFENRDVAAAFPGVFGAAAFTAALMDAGSTANTFVNDVVNPVLSNTEAQEVARITEALNSAAGLTGLGGVGYGTYRFTTAFTDHVANHEASDLWASYLHDKSSVDGLSVGNLRADYDLTYDGVVVGSDFYNNGRTTIGAAFAYADGDVSTKSGVSTKNDVDYYGGMIYGSVKGGAGMTYRAEIGYNRSSNDLTQWNTGKRITGSVDADAFHVGVAAEKEIRTGSSVWTPFLGLQYIDLSIDDYSDSLGFRHEGDSAGLWNMPVGVNYKYEVANGAWTYAPTVTFGYRFAFGDDSVDETLRYGSGAGSFGTEIAEDSFFTRIGFEAKKDNIGFGVHYGYERGSDTEANQWGINCSFFF